MQLKQDHLPVVRVWKLLGLKRIYSELSYILSGNPDSNDHGYPTDSDIISSDFIAVYLSLHIALYCDMLKVQLNINFKHY